MRTAIACVGDAWSALPADETDAQRPRVIATRPKGNASGMRHEASSTKNAPPTMSSVAMASTLAAVNSQRSRRSRRSSASPANTPRTASATATTASR